jgi:hypothetical protein
MNNIEEIKTKVCTTCNIVKPLTEYSKNSTKKNGINTQCKSCESERKKEKIRNKQEKERMYYDDIRTKYSINIKQFKDRYIKNYYVYIFIDPRNNLPFYVGKGNRRRMKAHFEPNRLAEISPKNSKIKKILSEGLEVTIEIYKTGLSSEEACEIEKELILKYGRVNLGTGILLNLTDGGEGAKSHLVSDETREKIKKTKSMRTYTHFNKMKKTASLISPEGILYTFTGIEGFRKEHNLGDTIRQVINGKIRSYKGWTSPDFIEYWRSKEPPYFTVSDPNGQILSSNRISEFCRLHDLNVGTLCQVLNGKRPHHKGFRLDQTVSKIKSSELRQKIL